MPLVRLQVRNEFSLAQPELYREANREDPKAVLDGVAVAGLVGILRQLGDLADFAADVFHGLQEQVMTTASRSHRLMVRVQNIEASLPPLEKAVLAQTSHLHFAYTAGCEWHPRITTARNHFIYNDLPHFIMDSYEECRDPPRLHMLDKFDTGGPGSCFRKYSDPAFFKKVSAHSDESYSEKTEKVRKTRKSKKKRSSRKNGELMRGEEMHSGRMQFISPTVNGRSSSSQTASMKSDLEDRSNSFNSMGGARYIECVFHPSNSVQLEKQDSKGSSSSKKTHPQKADALQSVVSPTMNDSISHDLLEKQVASSSSGVTWDEKEEILESMSLSSDRDKTTERVVEKHNSDVHADEAVTMTNVNYNDISFGKESNQKLVFSRAQTDDNDSEPDNYEDALNTIESECENDLDYETKREVQKLNSRLTQEIIENGVAEATSNSFDYNLSHVSQNGYTISLSKETLRDLPDSLLDMSEAHASYLGTGSPSDVPDREEMTRDSVTLNKETLRDLPNLVQEIPTLKSEPHASNLESASPSDVPDSEETIRVSVSLSKEMIMESVSLSKETLRKLPDSQREIPPLTPEPHTSHLGSVSPSVVPVSEDITKNTAHSVSSGSQICEHIPHTCRDSALDHSVCNDTFNDSSNVNDIVSPPIETEASFSGSKSSKFPEEEEEGKISSNNGKSAETQRESSGDHPVSFWTNGGLLGLEPSKPPDFNLSSSLSQGALTTQSEMDGDGDLSEEVSEQIPQEPSSRCSASNHDDGQASISGSSHLSNGYSHTERKTLGEINTISPGTGSVPQAAASPEMKAFAETNQGISENSSRVFGLGHRLLMNSFHRKVSVDAKSGPYSSLKSIILEQSPQNGIEKQPLPEKTFKEKVCSGYPIESLPPSPPLEHMKISFHPVSGLETSKLKLQFPDGSNHHESIRDMFPSFQLVPESSIPLDDSGSHSDDNDTFCRSSPYVSDGCLSPRSECNSDQWDSDETPESSDHGVLCDSPHRMSSTESMLSTKERGGVSNDNTTNGVEPSLSVPSLDFPCFDNVNPMLKHSKGNERAPPPPPPPPLPPTQWRISKTPLDMMNETHNYIFEDAEHINDQCLPEYALFQQPRFTKVEQIIINHNGLESHDNIIPKLKDKLHQQKLNGQKEVNQSRVRNEMDEREDFIQQIRTKSFNLRRTVTEKANTTTGPTAKVTAILEKANAIRQVVASDDGEDDDNWSDT